MTAMAKKPERDPLDLVRKLQPLPDVAAKLNMHPDTAERKLRALEKTFGVRLIVGGGKQRVTRLVDVDTLGRLNALDPLEFVSRIERLERDVEHVDSMARTVAELRERIQRLEAKKPNRR